MEEMVESILKAEEEAFAMKEAAKAEGAERVAKAQKRADELAKETEERCRKMREEEIALAEQTAGREYDEELARKREAAEREAKQILSDISRQVGKIVGRVTGGNR